MEFYTYETIKKCPYTSHILVPPDDEHQATFFVISLIEKGAATIEFFDKEGKSQVVEVKENTCFICPPFSPMLYKSWTKTFSCRDIYLNERTMIECCKFMQKGLYDELMGLEFPPVYRLSAPTIIYLAESTSALMGDKITPERDSIHRSLVCSLLAQYNLSKFSKNIYPEWISGFLRTLDDEEYLNVSIEKLVKTTNYSHGYVNREFKKYIGCSIKQFIIRKKIDKATILLATTDYSIEEISNTLHFSNVSNLINLFKLRYGVTPAKYRKLHCSAIQLDTYQEWGETTHS